MISHNSIGVAIGAERLDMVWLGSRFGGPVLLGHRSAPLPEGGDGPAIASLVNTFIGDYAVEAPEVHLAVPDDRLLVRTVSFPLAVKENFAETMRLEMDKYVPFTAEQVYHDSVLVDVDRTGKTIAVLLVVIRREDLDPWLTMCQGLGGGVSSISMTSAAAAGALAVLPAEKSPELKIYLQPDGEKTAVRLLSDRRLVAARTAARIEGELPEFLAPELRLCRELGLDRLGPPAVVLAAGGGDEQADCFGEIRRLTLGEKVPSVDYLAAWGLAVRGFKKIPGAVNLMPVSLRKRPDRRGVYLTLGLVVLNILLLLTWSGSLMMNRRMAGEQLETEIVKLTARAAGLAELERRVEWDEARISFGNDFQLKRPAAIDIVMELTRIIPKTVWLSHLRIKNGKVEIAGLADSAAELLPLLEESSLFREAVFSSTIARTKDGKEDFKIQLVLE